METKTQQREHEVFNRFTAKPRKGKSFKKPSLTVPKQDVKVSEVLKHFQMGMIDVGYDPNTAQWNDDNPNAIGIDLRRLDLTELKQLQDDIKYRIKGAESQFRDSHIAKKHEYDTQKAEAEKLKAEQVPPALI